MKYMFIALATSLAVLFIAVQLQIFWQIFYSNASCFSLLWLYLGNSQVSVYGTIGPTLVFYLFLFIYFFFIYFFFVGGGVVFHIWAW